MGDSEAAWDVTQQSWLAIIKGLRKLREPARFKAWAYRITTTKAVDCIRKDRRHRHLDVAAIPEPASDTDRDSDVVELLDKLDIKKKVVLSLYYFEQLNVTEISMALKIPKGTVRSRLHKAREALRMLWQQHIDK